MHAHMLHMLAHICVFCSANGVGCFSQCHQHLKACVSSFSRPRWPGEQAWQFHVTVFCVACLMLYVLCGLTWQF